MSTAAALDGAGNGDGVDIVDLADCFEHAPTVFAWYDAEWGDVYPREALRFTQAELAEPGPPIILVALDAEQRPVGTIAIDPDDVPERPELAPWLASLYVVAELRNRGIARRLIEAILRRGRLEGFDRLHLMTFDLEDWYLGLGWTTVAHGRYHDHDVAFMVHATDPADPPALT